MSKQAVLLIHGIGNQRPMDTLRGFVQAVWTSDSRLHRDHAQGDGCWSKPYALSQNFELRRLTTAENEAGIRTDFFEFYWAHLMQGTKVTHVVNWLRAVLWRKPASVPSHLKLLYAVLWLLVLAGLVLSAYLAFNAAMGHKSAWWLKWLLGLLIVPAVTAVVTEVVGDAARYLHVDPANIQSRHAIRSAGMQVLESLHQKGYERIIVVGHSLGSVIGYDLLTHAWASTAATEPLASDKAMVALQELERMAISGERDWHAWHAAQRRLFDQRSSAGAQWRVSDFVTLGSPLAHAQVLLAANAAELQRRMADREMPMCPPTLEHKTVDGQQRSGFSYPLEAAARRLHHAAPFATTRWTNLYFPNRLLLGGDLVGGVLAPIFGAAVHDVAVHTSRWGGLLSHTLYWEPEASTSQPDASNAHIAALRQALDLLDGAQPPISQQPVA